MGTYQHSNVSGFVRHLNHKTLEGFGLRGPCHKQMANGEKISTGGPTHKASSSHHTKPHTSRNSCVSSSRSRLVK